MLAVLSAFVGCLTLLLVEGSIVYYRHPNAPDWLRSRPSLQTTVSTLFGTGLVLSVVLLGQFFADTAANTLSLVQVALIAGSLGVTIWLWRKIRRIGRELDTAQNRTLATVVEHPAGREHPRAEPDTRPVSPCPPEKGGLTRPFRIPPSPRFPFRPRTPRRDRGRQPNGREFSN